jgi:enoyl-CoA hydratase/carnithine racemase
MAENANTPEVRTERRDCALWIWIDREERRNAINKNVIQGIETAFVEAQGDKELRCIVLTGAGRKAFCAGADLNDGTGTFTLGLDEPMTDFGKLARTVRSLGLPIVGRINGDCVAGGMGLMSLCDLVVVADHARFGLPEAKVGVFPMQVLVFLRHMIGARHVNELCLTGDLINSARAYEIGIANYVVPYEE